MNKLKVLKLNNGIRVVMDKTNFVDSCTIGIICSCGGYYEEEENLGISHFIEHMIFKGTESRSAKDISNDIEKIGARINAYTSIDHTAYYVKCIKDDVKKATSVLLDIINNSLFDEKELNKERKVILEEMKMGNDSPDDLCNETALIECFKNSRYGNPLIGTKKTLSMIDSNKIKEFFKNEYSKDNIVISICGNFDENEIIDLFSNSFEKFNDSKILKKYDEKEFKVTNKVIKKDIEQSHVIFITRSRKKSDYDKYKTIAFSNILGGGMSSRLFQNIRENKGLCYTTFSSYEGLRYDGAFKIYGGVSHNNVDKFIDSVNKELINLNKNIITKEEFESTKAQLLSTIIYGSENILSRMFANGIKLLYDNTTETIQDKINNVKALTLDEIVEESKVYSNPENFTKVIVTRK